MIQVSDDIYRTLAKDLMKAVEGKDYYRDAVYHDTEYYDSTLETTLIIRTEECEPCEGGGRRITDIIPIWWEFHYEDKTGDEIMTDFSWDRFKEYLNTRQ